MKIPTILIALTMLTTGLAGCTGDPDGGGNDEFDAETLQNLQDFINSTMATEWINDRGDSGHQWTLSLMDYQWLEVRAIRVVLGDSSSGENNWSQPAYIMSDEGYVIADSALNDGYSNSPIFGGNYSLCAEINSQTCLQHPLDNDRYMAEWSVIYRIHDVSATNYYYTGVLPPDPPLLENQNVTLAVSYVPWNSTAGEEDRIYATIVIELFPNEAPLHVDSFVTHIENGVYNNTLFHRIIDGFMIQGGNINGAGGYAGNWYGYCNGEPATTCDTADLTIPSESDNGLTHGPGTLAMARSSDPDSAGSQFYIVPSDSTPSHLDGAYTVFGQVISGQEHVDAISEVDTDFGDVPIHDVILEEAWVN